MKLPILLILVVTCFAMKPAQAQKQRKLYYSNKWEITTSDSAHYYRICTLDTVNYKFVDEVIDYLLDGRIVMRGSYSGGQKHGSFKLYYLDGQVESQGEFKDGKRFGLWKYYFPNGKIHREVSFNGDDFFVNKFYDTNERLIIENGTGEWQFEYEWPGVDFTYIVQGRFEDGKKQGEWWCSASNGDLLYTETFNRNKFKKGILFEGGEKKEYAKEFQNKFLLHYKFQVTEQFMYSNLVNRSGYPFLIFLPSSPNRVNSRRDTTDLVYTIVEKQAEYPGGFEAMASLLAKNMKYPPEPRRLGIQGTVFVSFIINKDGTISDIAIVKGIHADCDKEAIRVVSLFPKWIPGMQNGKAVTSRFVLPVKFKIAR